MTPPILPIAIALDAAIARYMEAAVNGRRDTRLLVPAPTPQIANDVHALLLRRATDRYRVYHVISDTRKPDKKRCRIRPSGLTSLRLGSFVAMVDPGQLTHIHDSIRGTGGSVRVEAFSDEWPWIDSGMEPLQFDGPILQKLLENWGLTVDHRDWKWIWDLVIKGLLSHTRTMSNRAEVLFERVLTHVDRNALADLPGVGEKLLFRAGIPRPVPPPSDDIGKFVSEQTRLCHRIVEKHRDEVELREHLHDLVRDLAMPDPDVVCQAIDSLLDGLGTVDRKSQGLLSLFGCWGTDDNTTHWKTLDVPTLLELFDVKAAKDAPSVKVWPSVDQGLVQTGRGKQPSMVATMLGATVDFRVKYIVPSAQWLSGGWDLEVIHLRRTLAKQPLDVAEGTASIQLNTSDLERQGKRTIPLRIAVTNGVEEGNARCSLSLCGPLRPSFVVCQPPFRVFDANAADEPQSTEQAMRTKEPIHLHLFHHGGGHLSVWDDDRDCEVASTSTGNGMASTTKSIDVSVRSDGMGRFTCSLGDARATLSIEAQDIQRGAFTLEDEFRTLLSQPSGTALRTITSIFEGEIREAYWNLGGMDAQGRRRSRFARWMDHAEGWRPIVTDLFGQLSDDMNEADLVRFSASLDRGVFESTGIPEKARQKLAAYRDARARVISGVESALDEDDHRGHPVYASHPIFVRSRRQEIERLLVAYLTTYCDLVEYSRDNVERLKWLELFALSHVDTICHWGTAPGNGTVFLVGPWHPLVLAKRFMVQAALSARAERGQKRKGQATYRHLASLMANTQGFRWQIGTSPDGNSLVPAYTSATSDPGWHLAINSNVPLSEWESLRFGIRRKWGLRVTGNASDDGALVTACVRAYAQATPARRSIGIRVRRGYDTEAVMQSLDRYLQTANEDWALASQQFAGGVRVYLEDRLDDSVEIGRGEPAFHVYSFSEDSSFASETHPCIHMLPPSVDTSLRADGRRIGMARGTGLGAVFVASLSWVTGSSEGVPQGVRYEHDVLDVGATPEELGALFRRSVGLICSTWAQPMVAVRSVGLPRRLKASWVVLRGTDVDPAILVRYIRDGAERQMERRTLWGYEIDVTGNGGSYYVLSTVPQAFTEAMKQFFGQGRQLGGDPIVQLGSIGVAVAGEAFRSSRHALGVLGLVGAVRMMSVILDSTRDNNNARVFLLPVDSFASFFGRFADSRRRADLLAVQVTLKVDDDSKASLTVSACGIESKLVSGTMDMEQATSALEQAATTEAEFQRLVSEGPEHGAMPERLALLELVRFGLRVSAARSDRSLEDTAHWEKMVFEAILGGRYQYRNAGHRGIVISTEGALHGAAESRRIGDGLWIRLTRTAWPGVVDTSAIVSIRQHISRLFPQGEAGGADLVDATPLAQQTSKRSRVSEEIVAPPQARPFAAVARAPATAPRSGVAGEPMDPVGRILLGVDASRRLVHWDPQSPTAPLDNYNLMITGSSGTGKTQLVKYLLAELRRQRASVLVLDMKNDFGNDHVFADTANFSTAFVSFDGLPYNPLIPYPVQHPRTGKKIVQWSQHVSGLTSALGDAYGLGVQQQMAVKNAIMETLAVAGINADGSASATSVASVPDFRSVGDMLAETNRNAYHRLDPLFSLNLFRREFRSASFTELLGQATILDLSQIPSDPVKNTLAQLVILSAHAYFNSQPQAEETRQFLVFDEAHRVLGSDYMQRLARECRAYGVGLVLASQYPSDFPADVSASMAMKVIHGNGRDVKRVQSIVRLLGCSERENQVANLSRFEAMVGSTRQAHTVIQTMSWPIRLILERLVEEGRTEIGELSDTSGFSSKKMPMERVVRRLEAMGLAEERDGSLELIAGRPFRRGQ